MTYTDFTDGHTIWWDLHSGGMEKLSNTRCLILPVVELDAILHRPLTQSRRACSYTDYGVAADYIEDHWDRLLSVAQTAEGVDPEPLLRRLVERLRLAFAEGQG